MILEFRGSHQSAEKPGCPKHTLPLAHRVQAAPAAQISQPRPPPALPAPGLTVQGGLAADVVEELGVVGKHPPAGGTGHHLLLRVAAQVLPQFAAALEGAVTVWGGTAQLRALPRVTASLNSSFCLLLRLAGLQNPHGAGGDHHSTTSVAPQAVRAIAQTQEKFMNKVQIKGINCSLFSKAGITYKGEVVH